jgi:hypothetical protein
LAELEVNGSYHSGDLVPSAQEYTIAIRLLAPHWVSASRVELYANGERIAEWVISAGGNQDLQLGVKWRGEHRLARPRHDQFLTVIATGPGITGSHWKTAKPYQPVSPDWTPSVLACSGAVWLDVDGDGQKTTAFDYASRLFANTTVDLASLVKSLAGYDSAVAAQAAHRYQTNGQSLLSPEAREVWSKGSPAVQAGFGRYLDAWRENQAARAKAR